MVQNNKEHIKQYSKEYYSKNHKENKDKHLLRAKIRGKRLRRATPLWANMGEIYKIYKKAKDKGLHVDHIIPIKGKNVSGLHVENNLQLLEPSKNLIKGNKYEIGIY